VVYFKATSQNLMMMFWVLVSCRLVGREQGFGETVSIFRAKTHQNPEEHHHHPHRRENLKSHISEFTWGDLKTLSRDNRCSDRDSNSWSHEHGVLIAYWRKLQYYKCVGLFVSVSVVTSTETLILKKIN
jgi:hypothetical protein